MNLWLHVPLMSGIMFSSLIITNLFLDMSNWKIASNDCLLKQYVDNLMLCKFQFFQDVVGILGFLKAVPDRHSSSSIST